LKTISGIIGFIPPIFIGKTIDYAVERNGKKVVTVLVMVFILLFLNAFIRIFESKVEFKIHYLITNEIKEKEMSKIVHMEMNNFEEIESGELISRLEDAGELVQIFIEITNLLFIDFIAFIFALSIMISVSPILSFICFVNIPIILIVQTIYGRIVGKKEKEIRLINDSNYSLIYEIISAIKEIKVFNLQKEICKSYSDILMRHTELATKKSNISIRAGFLSGIINGLFQLTLLAVGCYFIINGVISVGNYFTFNSYVSRFNTELQYISQFHMKKQLYLVSISRLKDLFSLKSEKERTRGEKDAEWKSGIIRLENVCFRYQKNTKIILHTKEFSFQENEISVITAKNGAGKSTLFDLITGFYIFQGKIYIGNADISTLSVERLRKEICYIQQKPYFFKNTILENLRLKDKNISIKEVENACKKVGMHKYINELPEKYNTIMNEEGTNFSGGQLQRLALARVVLSKKTIILLDEITSGVDEQGRQMLYNVIKELKHNHTILIISHDTDICRIADKIVYLIDGTICAPANSRKEQ